jgi:hypothetical protein
MEKDFENKRDLASIRWDGPYESLCDDPRFKDLLQRMNLPSHFSDVTIPYVFRSSDALPLQPTWLCSSVTVRFSSILHKERALNHPR